MRISSVLLVALSAMIAPAAIAQTPKIVMEEMMVPSGDAGIEIFVRNKRHADMVSFRPERTLAICARCHVSLFDGIRSSARRHVVDGLHRCARLRRLPP